MITINVESNKDLHYGQFKIISKKTGEDITNELLGINHNKNPNQ